MFNVPLMLLCDGYKLGHPSMFPDNTEYLFSNFTARATRITDLQEVVYLGGQYIFQEYFIEHANRTFFERPKAEVLEEYKNFIDGYLGPNSMTYDHVADLHDLGYLPLEFWAVPEGTPVPLRMPFFVVRSTVKGFGWVVNYFETLISSVLWQACTSASLAWRLRGMLDHYSEKQGLDKTFVDWQGHDFSYRGMSSTESAMLSGIGHLLSFTGTDTIPAILFAEKYYGATPGAIIGGSVPATEHAVMSAGGEMTEMETYNRIIERHPNGIVSIVSDTWDFWQVLTRIIPAMKEKILARDGKIVIRPDSGNPVKIICGDPDAPVGSPAHKGAVELLWETFGGTTTSKGFKLLDSHIGVIYGDAITFDRALAIIQGLAAKGFASHNVVFGIGSFTYQLNTRDTFGMAMKATAGVFGGEERMLFKDPVTDDGTKKSARGHIALSYDYKDHIEMRDQLTQQQWESIVTQSNSAYRMVWRNGAFIEKNKQTFQEVKDQLASWEWLYS